MSLFSALLVLVASLVLVCSFVVVKFVVKEIKS